MGSESDVTEQLSAHAHSRRMTMFKNHLAKFLENSKQEVISAGHHGFL